MDCSCGKHYKCRFFLVTMPLQTHHCFAKCSYTVKHNYELSTYPAYKLDNQSCKVTRLSLKDLERYVSSPSTRYYNEFVSSKILYLYQEKDCLYTVPLDADFLKFSCVQPSYFATRNLQRGKCNFSIRTQFSGTGHSSKFPS